MNRISILIIVSSMTSVLIATPASKGAVELRRSMTQKELRIADGLTRNPTGMPRAGTLRKACQVAAQQDATAVGVRRVVEEAARDAVRTVVQTAAKTQERHRAGSHRRKRSKSENNLGEAVASASVAAPAVAQTQPDPEQERLEAMDHLRTLLKDRHALLALSLFQQADSKWRELMMLRIAALNSTLEHKSEECDRIAAERDAARADADAHLSRLFEAFKGDRVSTTHTKSLEASTVEEVD